MLEEYKKYKVEITEVLKKEVEVIATNEVNAKEQAELEWDQGKHVLSADTDFDSSNFITLAEIVKDEVKQMKEFDVEITEFLKRTVTVQAENADEAMDLVHDQHSQGIHVLDAGDFSDMTIETIGERNKENFLDVLLVEPMKPPIGIQIPDTLEALQSKVGGFIEVVNVSGDDPIAIVCNEEGKLNGLPYNRGLYDEQGELADVIAGSFVIVGDGGENFESLTPELKEKYIKQFRQPERFYKLAGKIVVHKIKLEKEQKTPKKNMENER